MMGVFVSNTGSESGEGEQDEGKELKEKPETLTLPLQL